MIRAEPDLKIVGVPNLEGEDVGVAWYEKGNGEESKMKVGCSKAL